jgi:phage-related protein
MPGFDGTILCYVPDVPISESDEWRLRKAQFGDGYQQRVLDGINALEKGWSLTWADREQSVILGMTTYLESLKAASFTFKDPTTGLSWKVFCDAWSITWGIRRRGGIYYGTMSADFRKANGVLV